MLHTARISFFTLGILLVQAAVSLAVPADILLRDNVGVVVSGDITSSQLKASDVGAEDLRSALRRSLNDAGLLERARGEGRYTLEAVFESIDQFSAGFSAKARVRYVLTDRVLGEKVFEETIAAEYAMAVWDSYLRSKILTRIGKGALRANADLLAGKLLELTFPDEAVSSLSR